VPDIENVAVPLPPTAETPPAPPAPEPELVGKIVEAPAPAESVGEKEFRTPTAADLTNLGFPPEPPLEAPPATPESQPELTPAPPPVPAAKMPAFAGGQSSEGKTAGDSRVGGGPPTTTSGPVPIPPPPAFDDLSEKTKAELRAGYRALKGTEEGFRFVQPVDAPAVTTQPPVSVATPKDAPPDEPIPTTLSEKTRLELEAGRARIASRNADYQAVQERVAKQAAKDLADGKVGDLSYPTR
jgi:hypothetical protein